MKSGTPVLILDIDNSENINQFLRLSQVDFMQVLLDLNCTQATRVLERSSEAKILNGSRNFVIFGDNLNQSLGILNRQNLNFDSSVILVTQNTTAYSFHVHRVSCSERKREFPLRLDSIGNFSTRLQLSQLKVPKRMPNLEGNIASVCINVSI